MLPVALVTGASSGLGEVFARRLSRDGYHVILVARRKDRLEKLASELGHAEALKADLSVQTDLSLVERRIAEEPSPEFVVNNAGYGISGGFYDDSVEVQDRMHRLHVIATERITHAALKAMSGCGQGNIINVASVAGFLSTPFNVSYCATKAWMINFTEGLYLELKTRRSPVRIQALCPGFTYTEFHDTLGMDRDSIPRSLWMSAEQVVDDSLRNLAKDKPIVVPGWRYRLFLLAYRPLLRSLKYRISIKYGSQRVQRTQAS